VRRLAVILLACSTAHAAPRYDLDVSIDTERHHVEGTARIEVANDGAEPMRELWLWQYAERFATRSDKLDDVNFYWVYPR
jgi:hypothetical protein